MLSVLLMMIEMNNIAISMLTIMPVYPMTATMADASLVSLGLTDPIMTEVLGVENIENPKLTTISAAATSGATCLH